MPAPRSLVDHLARPAKRLTQLWHEPCADCTWPDCWRTVIAMLLGADEPEDVPHFGDFVPGEPTPEGMGRKALQAWLRERGVEMVEIPLPKWSIEAIEGRLQHWLKSCPAMLEGKTAEGHQHCVAVIDGKVIDTVPWSEANPITEPGVDGLFWLTILVPLRGQTATSN